MMWASVLPDSPQLNPVENMWQEIGEKSYPNLTFESMEQLEMHLAQARMKLENEPQPVESKASRIDSLEVRWPSGITQKFQSIKTNRIIKIQEHNPRFLVDVEPQSQSWSKLANIKSSAQMDLMFGLAYNGRWHYPHSLYQNYPNPFNPETWIPYQLAMDAKVAVSIYDMNSVLVHRIDLGLQKSGYYFSRESAAHWNGRNMNGEQVASGIYFYRLQVSHPTSSTESQTPLRKMIILN